MKIKFKDWLIVVFILLGMLSHRDVLAGKYAADFLRIGVGARALALGGAYTAIADDGTAFYWNPAGLAQISRFQAHVGHVPMFGGLAQYNFANVALNLGTVACAVGWIRMGVDEIPRYSKLQIIGNMRERSTGRPEGFFNDTEDAVFFSFARAFPFTLSFGGGFSPLIIPAELYVGATAKFIHHQLAEATGTGQGVDVGALVRLLSRRRIKRQSVRWMTLGVSARDISRTTLTWSTDNHTRDQVGLTITAGTSVSQLLKSLRTRVTFSFDQEFGAFKDRHLGAEITMLSTLALRAGLQNQDLTVGAGIRVLGLKINYAFVTYELGNTHRISGSVSF